MPILIEKLAKIILPFFALSLYAPTIAYYFPNTYVQITAEYISILSYISNIGIRTYSGLYVWLIGPMIGGFSFILIFMHFYYKNKPFKKVFTNSTLYALSCISIGYFIFLLFF